MKQVSVEQAFQWAQRFAAREWRLMLPVALALIAFPSLFGGLLAPQGMQVPLADLQAGRATVPPLGLLLAFVVLLLNSIGQLTLVAMALVPRISVREALALALWRLGTLISAGLIMACLVLLGALAVGILLTLSGIDIRAQQGLLLGVIMGCSLFLFIRLSVLGPLIVDHAIGPVAALRRAWTLTRGTFWRMLAAIGIYSVGATVVVFAFSYAFGTVIALTAKLAGQPEVGIALAELVTSVVRALAAIGLQLLLVALYRQLAGSRAA